MARAFRAWTVLPHKPIEKLADNLWRVSGSMPNRRTQRQMVLARMADGRVVVHNAIALADAELQELEAWGTPSVLVVPNAFHRQDAAIWKDRYPRSTVVAPAPARKAVARVVPVDVTTEDAPGDETVRMLPLDGLPGEGVLEVRSGAETTLVFCDAVMNMPKLKGFMAWLLAPTGQVTTPRIVRMMGVKDRKAFSAHLERLADTPGLRRILVGHGRPIEDDPAGALRGVAAQIRR
jgi:hypothetical protein